MVQSSEYMLRELASAQARRDWSTLPQSFEQDAVKFLFGKFKPYFSKQEIKQRIAASKAATFSDLRDAITK